MSGALVTGAANGIGRAVALRMASAGHGVVLVDRDPVGLQELCDHLAGLGQECFAVEADVTDERGLHDACCSAVQRYGSLDCAINAAGIDPEVQSDDWNVDDARKVINVNLIGVIAALAMEVRFMRPSGGGSIVNIGSIASFRPLAGKAGYVGSKHAIIGVTRTAALQYAPIGIRVNAVCPGATRTNMTAALLSDKAREAWVKAATPLNRIGEPEDMSNAAAWLCSSEASFITGQALLVDGGMNLA